MIINKRLKRGFRVHWVQYVVLIAIIVLGMGMFLALWSGASNVYKTVEEYKDSLNAQHGYFTMMNDISDSQLEKINDLGAETEKHFYSDCDMSDESVIRISALRESIDLVYPSEGVLPVNDDEIAVEKMYGGKKNYAIGDTIDVAGKKYKVTGFVSVPDYNLCVASMADSSSNPNKFGLGFMTQDGYDKYIDSASEELIETKQYAYRLDNNTKENEKKLKDHLNDDIEDNHLFEFVNQDDNIRMNNYKSTCVMEIAMAIAMGAILCIIIAYCIAVYSIHRIDEEVKNIGTLYAMGYLRKEMVRHYLIIPTLIAVIGSVAGTIIGVALSPAFATINTAYFSMPVPSVHISPLMVAYGILVPVIPSFFINYIVLNKKLKEKPVNMLRQTASGGKKKQKKIESDSFVRIFRKRQLASEMGGNIVLFFGIFFSVMMLVLGYSMKGNINNLIN